MCKVNNLTLFLIYNLSNNIHALKKNLNRWMWLDPVAHMLKDFCLHILISQFAAYSVQFWFDFVIIYRMCRMDIRSSVCKISKQLVNFKILYLNVMTFLQIHNISHKCGLKYYEQSL